MIEKVKDLIYDPTGARVLYDAFATISVCLFAWGLFNFTPINNIHLIDIFLFTVLCLAFNYFLGIYTHLKTAPVIIKSFFLILSPTLALLLYFMFGLFSLPLIAITASVAVLTILPRFFFNLYSDHNKSLVAITGENLPILVVGGGGYVGSHVVDLLLEKGYKVRVFDKFLYGREVLSDFSTNKNLEIIDGDISDLFNLNLALKDVQAVVHLAGLVGDPACALDDNMTRHINIASTKMLKESVKAFGIKRFIFASSCSVYGASNSIVNESSKLNPVSLYAKTKADSEREIIEDQYDNFHPTILRFATVFGHSRKPRFDLVANLFTAQAYWDGVITVTGGRQWRPFIHVSDLAVAILKVLEAPEQIVSRQIFNVGDDRLNTTIGNLAELVANVVTIDKNKKKVRILVRDDQSDPRNYRVSFGKIESLLGFHAQISLEEGVREILDNFKSHSYTKDYHDEYYSNLEMTKELIREFKTEEYRRSHFSLINQPA